MRTLIVVLVLLYSFLFGILYAEEIGHSHTTSMVAEQ